MSNKKSNKSTVEEVVEEEVITETPVEEEVVEVAVEEEIIEEEVVEYTIGVVSNCDQLRVRKEPNINSEELSRLNRNDEILFVEAENSDPEWLKIYDNTKEHNIGYCMRRFITVKQ